MSSIAFCLQTLCLIRLKLLVFFSFVSLEFLLHINEILQIFLFHTTEESKLPLLSVHNSLFSVYRNACRCIFVILHLLKTFITCNTVLFISKYHFFSIKLQNKVMRYSQHEFSFVRIRLDPSKLGVLCLLPNLYLNNLRRRFSLKWVEVPIDYGQICV